MPSAWLGGFPGVVFPLGIDSVVIIALSLVLFVYERALVPLYGSAPSAYTLNSAVICAAFLAGAHPLKVSQARTVLFAGVVLSVAPLATYWVAVWTSRWRSPILGPLTTHFIVLVPLLSALTTLVAEIKLVGNPRGRSLARNSISHRFLAGFVCFGGTVGLAPLWAKVSLLNNVSESQIFLGLAAAFFNIWIGLVQIPRRPVEAQRKKKAVLPPSPGFLKPSLLLAIFNILWWTGHGLLISPVLQHPLPQPYTHPTFPLRIHSSVQSTTGLIVVGEALPPPSYEGGPDQEMHSLRYLRASHSLLGGVWMGGKVATLDDAAPWVDSYGTELGDSIYSTFVLQEAARLVNSSVKGASGHWDRALIIGLGVGISATAFGRHGITTTIVEIDPAVYDAARLFFGLPEHTSENLFLEDARSWAVMRRSHIENGARNDLFDIIVHDCFSGGGVPEHIFTLEFWDDLKVTLNPEGVLAVNFAGMIISESSRMISQTLLKSFGNCRAFHDSQTIIPEEKYETELINLVFFCSPDTNPLTFRKARRSDYLDSYLREHVLSTLPHREVSFELLTGQLDDTFILTDTRNPLGKLQNAQGHHHWSLMREVLPDIFWETY
ncbi:spermidine synthase [Mycena belliarum]|uniref:Spermidine synthase n=1 Tax=Mycena belliarum TaxID=1033014 RepID=A0AAD6XX41_9AGAR|nr:spermidine synthase [Mycena belliae]